MANETAEPLTMSSKNTPEKNARKYRILIAEDDAISALNLGAIIETMGHTVVATTGNGREAVELTRELCPDLVLMDIKMPGLTGLQAAEIIYNDFPTAVIIVTAYPDDSFIDTASHLGISNYLVKPISASDLKPAMKLAIDRFHERQSRDKEIDRMKERLANLKIIERAKWVLIENLECTENDAYRRMQNMSRNKNLRMGEIARMIVEEKGLLLFGNKKDEGTHPTNEEDDGLGSHSRAGE